MSFAGHRLAVNQNLHALNDNNALKMTIIVILTSVVVPLFILQDVCLKILLLLDNYEHSLM